MLGQQLIDLVCAEGLAHKVVTALQQHLLFILFKGGRGQGDDDSGLALGRGFDPSGGCVAVHDRHAHVHPDQVGLPAGPHLEGSQAVRRFLNLKAR